MFEIFSRSWGETIDFESMYEIVDGLGIRGYQLQHREACERIWEEMVPESGRAETLQGELLRQAEMLRYEAQFNGNMNWDDSYESFCSFIGDALERSGLLSGSTAYTNVSSEVSSGFNPQSSLFIIA